MSSRWSPALRLLAAGIGLVTVAIVLTACAPVSALRGIGGRWLQDERAQPFYKLAGPIQPGAPGAVVRAQALAGPPSGSRAWRVLYHSRDGAGADIITSGLVIVPTGPAPAGGRRIVSWAHPTTGVAADCAPSLTIGGTSLIPGLSTFLRDGDIVAAADYPGLGVPGPSSYLLGVPEAHSVLDAARAARNLLGAEAGRDLLLWGHSQGGQAALFAAQEAASYTPELRLRAVAVAAPASDLSSLIADDIGDISGVTIGSYAFSAYAVAYAGEYPGLSLGDILTPAGVAATPRMTSLCLLSQQAAIHAVARPLIGGYVRSDPGSTEPWATMLRENTPGGAPIGVPILVAQGLRDTLVRPQITSDFVGRLCAAGEDVRYVQLPDDGHGLVALASAGQVTAWFRAVDSGEAPASSCR